MKEREVERDAARVERGSGGSGFFGLVDKALSCLQPRPMLIPHRGRESSLNRGGTHGVVAVECLAPLHHLRGDIP